jgi:hypothetical protein
MAVVIDSAERTGDPVSVTLRGRAVAVVVDPVVFAKMVDDAEDALDRAELALTCDEGDYCPWEQVKADLGLSGWRQRPPFLCPATGYGGM